MLAEVIRHLEPRAGGRYIDCTVGGAGYTIALAQVAGRTGKIIGIDQDELAITHAREEISLRKLENIILVRDNFKNLKTIVTDLAATGQIDGRGFDGIVFDLGLSSAQLDDETRGFSFKGDRPLDMAFGPESLRRTTDIVNRYPHGELARIFRELGEERRAGRLASAILEARRKKRLATTGDLVGVIEGVLPVRAGSRIHPATKVFQALRMETNGELETLLQVLPAATNLLAPRGRLVVVSFHSGEDRIVKRFLKGDSHLQILTKRPLVPTESETATNPRARSAKLRAALKLDNFQKE